MKKIIFITLLLINSFYAISQISQTNRVEIEVDRYENDYHVIPIGKEGLIMFNHKDESDKKNVNQWIFNSYDQDFKKKWDKVIEVNSELMYNDYCMDNQYLYILFVKYQVDEYQIVKIDVSSGMISEINGVFLKKFFINSFKIKNENMYINGIYKNKSTLGYINLNTHLFSVLPVSFENAFEIQSIEFDNDIANVVFVKRIKKVLSLSIYSYNKTEKVSELSIMPTEGRNLLNARINILGNDQLLVIGTYAEEGGSSSHGMFIAKYVNKAQLFIKFYNFNDFQNFLVNRTEKKQEKIKEKIDAKEAKGIELNFNYNLLVHDIIERENEYLMIAEAYYPTFRSQRQTSTYYVDGKSMTNTYTIQVFDGWLYTHALIGSFDKDGALLWDNAIEMGDFKSNSLVEKIKVNTDKNDIVLTYVDFNEIKTKVISGNKVIDNKQEVQIQTNNNDDKVKFGYMTHLEYWYDKYFIVWGYQKIKNNSNDVKLKRDVFYFNKIHYN
jgi:hypothetical protein